MKYREFLFLCKRELYVNVLLYCVHTTAIFPLPVDISSFYFRKDPFLNLKSYLET